MRIKLIKSKYDFWKVEDFDKNHIGHVSFRNALNSKEGYVFRWVDWLSAQRISPTFRTLAEMREWIRAST